MNQYRLYNAQSRPDLWVALSNPTHPLNAAWPTFLDQDPYFTCYSRDLNNIDAFAKFQYAIVELSNSGRENVVACGRSIPFYWPELDLIGGKDGLSTHPEVLGTLPDQGYDAILSRGIEQYHSRQDLPASMGESEIFTDPARTRTERPNALSAISITVTREHRSKGLAEVIIGAMKRSAIKENLEMMVVPLRPTRKSEFPTVAMDDYITWPAASISASCSKEKKVNPNLPYDPWLRKHLQLGAKVAKVASCSMRVEGSVAEWQNWTGLDFRRIVDSKQAMPFRIEHGSSRQCIKVIFPGGLVPLLYYVEEQWCVYIEPNVWLYHELAL
jgi:hypothetical protein